MALGKASSLQDCSAYTFILKYPTLIRRASQFKPRKALRRRPQCLKRCVKSRWSMKGSCAACMDSFIWYASIVLACITTDHASRSPHMHTGSNVLASRSSLYAVILNVSSDTSPKVPGSSHAWTWKTDGCTHNTLSALQINQCIFLVPT